MTVVTFTMLARAWASHMNAAHDDNQVIVAEYSKKPAAVLISHDLWLSGQERAPERAGFEQIQSGAAPGALKAIRERLRFGKHTVVTVDGHAKVAFAPYEWARTVFEELGLPATPHPPECALIVYRKASHVTELAERYAGRSDPDFEMDRCLTAGRARIPAIRRERLRAVVYVHDGVVARMRAVQANGQWEDLPGGLFSLAPVSQPLTAHQITSRFPTLEIRLGDRREPRWGLWREYVDLEPADRV